MSSLQAAIFAMRASQTALQTIGNNLANVNTPGYHRQLVDLADRRPQTINGLSVGQGVEISQIRRLRDASLEAVMLHSAAEQGQQTAELDVLRQLESLLTPGEGTLHAQVQNFFSQWELLASEPAEGVRRQEVLQSAVQIANEINSLSQSLDGLKAGLRTEIESAVNEVNWLSENVAALNQEIRIAEGRGLTPNDLLDKRDHFASQLAELIDASLVRAGSIDAIRLAGGESLVTTQAKELSYKVMPEGDVQLFVDGPVEPVRLTAGRLAGLVEGCNTYIRQVRDQLAELTSGLIHSVNSVHASGLGAGDGLAHFKSTRAVIPTNVPLRNADLPFPVGDGEISVGVTDKSTGVRTLHRIAIDPDSDSLESIAAKIDAIGGITSSADPITGQLRVDADFGFTFDLTGGLPSAAVVDAATGTSVPDVTGQYLGAENDAWSLTVVGSGRVGVDPDIVVEVRNQSGALLETLSVGVGYAPGDPLELPDGVMLHLPAGTLSDGDTFHIPVSADSDTAGLLAAIGAHDLFTGNRPGAVAVNSALLNDPLQLSVSQSGEPGDNRVAAKLAALGRRPILSEGTETFVEFLSLASADSGLRVAQSANELEGLRQLNDLYTEQRQALSGVNPDEELIRMLEFQRMFEAAAQMLSSVNETMDTLFSIFR